MVGATKASFLGGRKLRVRKFTSSRGGAAAASRSVTVCAAADPDRPLWFPGSTPPPWLDGRFVPDHHTHESSMNKNFDFLKVKYCSVCLSVCSLPGDFGFDPLGFGK